ncbi:MAG: hypothetical protein Q9217_006600 [Psora testacea]
MVRYLNPGGHDWGKENSDGYALSQIVFIIIYTIFFFTACTYLWLHRMHPVIKMRKINLALMSVLILHVYLFMIFMVYPLNGEFPCGVEFWIMSLYLPIGIGLFQAQNQQLLIVSREQNQLLHVDHIYKPLAGVRSHGIGTPNYWIFRFKLWWNRTSKQGKYEGFVLVGIVIQVASIATASSATQHLLANAGVAGNGKLISKELLKIAHPSGRAPSIVWQFLWNFFFGPYLIWKIRMIRDIYHWRLQTILAVVAGIPGTPLWLASVYTDSFASVNKYWVQPMWFVPGLITMELTTLIFPIVQIQRHKQAVRETTQALADFDAKHLNLNDTSTIASGSMATRSTGSKGKMYSMESLDECLQSNYDGLQVYASCIELNGENIIFLVKVLKFKQLWLRTFSSSSDFLRARMTMFRAALSIFVSLVHSETANYPINIESPVYSKLESIFGQATALVACVRRGSTVSTPMSQVTPWDEPTEPTELSKVQCHETFHMRAMMSTPPTRSSVDNESREHIMSPDDPANPYDPLAGYMIPVDFDSHIFDAAFKSIKYMVWTETWQRYMNWKKTSGAGE